MEDKIRVTLLAWELVLFHLDAIIAPIIPDWTKNLLLEIRLVYVRYHSNISYATTITNWSNLFNLIKVSSLISEILHLINLLARLTLALIFLPTIMVPALPVLQARKARQAVRRHLLLDIQLLITLDSALPTFHESLSPSATQAMKAMPEEINHLRASVKVRDDLLRTKQNKRVNHLDPPGFVLKKSSLSSDSDSEDDDNVDNAKAILSPVPPVLDPISAKQHEERAAHQAIRDTMPKPIWDIPTSGIFSPVVQSSYFSISRRQQEEREALLYPEQVAARKKAEHDAWKAKSKAACDAIQQDWDEGERKRGYKNYSPEFYAAIRKKSSDDAMTAYYKRVAEQDTAKTSPFQCPHVSGGTSDQYRPGRLTPHGFRINPHTKFLTTDPDQISHLLNDESYDTLPPPTWPHQLSVKLIHDRPAGCNMAWIPPASTSRGNDQQCKDYYLHLLRHHRPLTRFEQHVLDRERVDTTSQNFNAIPWPIDTRDDEYKKRGPITDFTIPEDDVNTAADLTQRPSPLVHFQSFFQSVPLPPVAPSPMPQILTNPLHTNSIVNQPSTRTTEELERSLLSAQEEIRVLRMQQVSPPDVSSVNTKVSSRHRSYEDPTPPTLVSFSYIPDDVRDEKMRLASSRQHDVPHARVKLYHAGYDGKQDPDDDDHRKRRNLEDADLPGLIEDIDSDDDDDPPPLVVNAINTDTVTYCHQRFLSHI